MKFAINTLLLLTLLGSSVARAQSPMREQALRKAAINAGVKPLSEIYIEPNSAMADIGAKLFESKLLSFNGEMSCQTCHLDAFSSADGLPNAIGTGGFGEGRERQNSKGDIVPRNTLPLWGRGTKGFDTFFWGGKVSKTTEGIESQFGASLPSNDPLVVAVHLPFVEIREMVVRDDRIKKKYEKENFNSAEEIFAILVERVKNDPVLGTELGQAANIKIGNLKFANVAEAIAEFIREKFKIKTTQFNEFVFNGGTLTKEQLRGGLIFYGKGQCSICHSGALMSDLKFYVMPFEQVGFGKNGFGVDYGRFNATRNPDDIYKFRTPPLVNVAKTGPYSHSGAYHNLNDIILAHVDPLANYNGKERTPTQRREDLSRIANWSKMMSLPEPLSVEEIELIIEFLNTTTTE